MRCLCALSCAPSLSDCSIIFSLCVFSSMLCLGRRLVCFQRRSCITTRSARPSFVRLLVKWIKWASNEPFTVDLGPRGCFQCHSNRKAWILSKLWTTTAGFHGLHPIRVVDFAPPTISPLCWRSLLVKSHVLPLYVHP